MTIPKIIIVGAVVALLAAPQPVLAFGCPLEPSNIDCTGRGYVSRTQPTYVPQFQYPPAVPQYRYQPAQPYGGYGYVPPAQPNIDAIQMQHLLGGYMRQQSPGY